MADKVKKIDTALLHQQLIESVQADELYKIRNDAKIRAVVTAKSYEEFKDIVAAAHLTPLSKADKEGRATQRSWNKALH